MPENTGELTTWILVTPDNIVTVLVPHCEMGQGAQTALAMMAAEEMDADWNLVRVKEAPALDAYANAYIVRAFVNDVPGPFERGFDYGTYRLARWFGLQVTGGSMSVRGTGHHGMRVAGAAAREMLVAAAAAQFGVRAVGMHRRQLARDARRVGTFRDLRRAGEGRDRAAGADASGDEGSEVVHASPQAAAAPRHAIEGRWQRDLRHRFHDARICCMPRWRSPRSSAASWCRSIRAAAEKMPGVKQVVRLDEAVAVVADTYWRARMALATLKPQFDDAGHGGVSTATIFDAFDKSLGAPPDMPASAATVIKADYKIPFLPHATMEPMACTARVHGRSRGGVGRHAGSAERAQDRGRCAGLQSRAGAVHEPRARRRLRTQAARLSRLRRHERAHREGDVAGAGEDDLEPRDRHAARLLPAGRHGAICRRARCVGHAARGAFVLRGRRRRRIGVHAVRDRRSEIFGARRQASDPHRTVALGAQLAARLLQGVVHRRDGARGEEGSVRSSAAT